MPHNEEYIQYCEKAGVFALFFLREGEYEYDILGNMVCGNNAAVFDDVIALLLKKRLISVKDKVVSIEPDGRIELLNNKRAIAYSDGTMMLLPSWTDFNKKPIDVRFKDMLQGERQKVVAFLSKSNYVNDPVLFVDFITGKNQGEDVFIHPDKLPVVSYLLKELCRAGYLKLSHGKEWTKYIESNISPFSLYGEKEQIKKYARVTNGVRWMKLNTVKDIDDLLLTLGTPKHKRH